jgi:hypothetical protein
MSDNRRKNVPTTRGRPFQKGNPGRPRGSKHKTTLAMEALLADDADTITRKAIELAKGGDLIAIRICMDRLLPPRRDRSVAIDLPKLESATDATAAIALVAEKVGEGELSPDEGAAVNAIVGGFIRAHEITVLERRLEIIEKRLSDDGK